MQTREPDDVSGGGAEGGVAAGAFLVVLTVPELGWADWGELSDELGAEHGLEV